MPITLQVSHNTEEFITMLLHTFHKHFIVSVAMLKCYVTCSEVILSTSKDVFVALITRKSTGIHCKSHMSKIIGMGTVTGNEKGWIACDKLWTLHLVMKNYRHN